MPCTVKNKHEKFKMKIKWINQKANTAMNE